MWTSSSRSAGGPRIPQGELRDENAQLREALGSHAVVDQASGVLLAVGQLRPDRGRHVLRKVSQRTGIKLRHVAELLIEWARTGHCVPTSVTNWISNWPSTPTPAQPCLGCPHPQPRRVQRIQADQIERGGSFPVDGGPAAVVTVAGQDDGRLRPRPADGLSRARPGGANSGVDAGSSADLCPGLRPERGGRLSPIPAQSITSCDKWGISEQDGTILAHQLLV
ncbi:ANTAR domain-containing protein [Streptomyces sp. NPDC091209]|uniref:ANTAR domain-containing protein n=1 Tax=Streptomyces sp. NPDC091209 TaxID=3365974 RepID=UPI00382A7C69